MTGRRLRLHGGCPDCGSDMILRQSKVAKSGWFYGCVRYPACTSTHGAHADGTPLGIPANSRTRDARRRAHAEFDRLWNSATSSGRKAARERAYKWLAETMGIPPAECHIGRFDFHQCEQVITLVRQVRGA